MVLNDPREASEAEREEEMSKTEHPVYELKGHGAVTGSYIRVYADTRQGRWTVSRNTVDDVISISFSDGEKSTRFVVNEWDLVAIQKACESYISEDAKNWNKK